MQYLVASLIGLVSGIFSGLFGVGGGIVMVPAMLFFLKLDPKMAIGTSLAVIIPTAIIGTLKHHLHEHVDWKVALSLAPMAIVGGYLGAWMTAVIPGETLKKAFGVFIILMGLRLVFSK